MYIKARESPIMIMLCGLPGSRKSSMASSIKIEYPDGKVVKPKIHASDNLRKEFYGDEKIQGNSNEVFNELHKRIKNDLNSGLNTIYDATNTNKKQRIEFLNQIKKINCYPVCIVMATEYNTCLNNNLLRNKAVPENIINRMLKNWQPPDYSEGFKEIYYKFSCLEEYKEIYTIKHFFEVANKFDQENSHHKFSLGEHSEKTGAYIQDISPDNFWLLIAAMLHDNGKLNTKTKYNAKGEVDGNYHYYQHHCVGAYQVMQYLDNMNVKNPKIIAYVTNLIYYHMHPYTSWKQSEKRLIKDMQILGKEMINDIYTLHIADKFSH